MRTERDPDGRVFTVIERLDEMPVQFATEEDEANWWDTHIFSEELVAYFRSQPLPPEVAAMLSHLRDVAGRQLA